MSVNQSLANGAFQKNLAFGQMAESAIAKWLIRRGNAILPIYDIEYDTGKGPRLFDAGGQFAAPDLLVWSSGGALWCEAKHKTVWTWYRKKSQWETGIDQHHWMQYHNVATRTGLPVWLLFLHSSDLPDPKDRLHGCPSHCPTGLFGGELQRLFSCVSHTSEKHGRYGMVYWGHGDLQVLDVLENLSAGKC